MKIGIMQPYLFPYIGYFQLINAVDKFVIYDDVQFIKNGWINRNRILVNGKASYFTFRLKKASTFDKINQREFTEQLPSDIMKFLKGLEISYRKAPYFKTAYALISKAVQFKNMSVADSVTHSLRTICDYIGIRTEFILSSKMQIPDGLHAQDRVVWISKALGATDYINMASGMALYDKETFAANGIKLSFLQPQPRPYPQFKYEFVPNLSIIDVMMFNSKDGILQILKSYLLDDIYMPHLVKIKEREITT